MRVGTWNLDGRWSPEHERFLRALACDVLLLTEVRQDVAMTGHDVHLTRTEMTTGRRWAAVASHHAVEALPDPHPTSAMAVVGGVTFCSSCLPWRTCGRGFPWVGERHADKTTACLAELRTNLPHSNLVWGGDWNHALSGREWAGSKGGRAAILEMVAGLDLQVPTAHLPHPIDQLLSIDHLAVPSTWSVTDVSAHPAVHAGHRLSDHDAYVVETG